MQYQTINPYTEELVRTFPQHTDEDIDSIIASLLRQRRLKS